MSWLARLRNLARSARHGRDLDRELDFHLAELADTLEARGLPRAEAELAARRQFGHRAGVREATREVDIVAWLETLGQDLRYAIRGLRAAPGFTFTVLLSLGLGIGANTAIFSLFNALLLRALPVSEPQALVQVTRGETGGAEFTNPIWEALRREQDAFSGVLAFSYIPFNLASGGEARHVSGNYVGGDFFPALGVRPAAGRLLTGADDYRGCPALAVLGHGFWQSEYAGDPGVVGRTLALDGHPFEVIGVAPPGFFGVEVGRSVQVYVPLCAEAVIQGTNSGLDVRAYWFLTILGRPRPGLSPGEVDGRLAALSPGIFAATAPADWDGENLRSYRESRLQAVPATTGVSEIRLTYRPALLMLMGVVGLVLLIACANVANLLLARGAVRGHEIAMRLALGASRGRLIRQALTESLLLALLGTAVGVGFARWSSALLVRMLSTRGGGVWLDLTPDLRLLGFTAAIAAVTGLLFGLLPAWRATRVDPQGAMRAGGRGVITGGSARITLGKGLVLAQVALSLVLVSGAALLLGTFRTLATLDPGFEREGRLAVNLNLVAGGYPSAQRLVLERQALERLRAVPGVTQAGSVMVLPVSGSGWNGGVFRPGRPEPTEWAQRVSYFNRVSRGFFAASGTRLLAGRDFGPEDVAGGPRAVIVNEAMAARFFPGESPVGQSLLLETGPDPRLPVTVVGVVEDTKYRNLREDPEPIVYQALEQATDPSWAITYILATDGPPDALVPAVRRALAEVDPRISFSAFTVESQVARSLSRERLLATLSGFFGVLALVLALVGLYGIMAYTVARRRNEIGIRLALGAERRRVMGMIVAEVGRLVAPGLALGLVGALAGGRLVEGFLYGLRPSDPATLGGTVVLVLLVAVAAGAIPAWRAARMDPVAALRED